MERLNEKKKLDAQGVKPILCFLQQENDDDQKQLQLSKATQLINEAKEIIFLGSGASGVLAKYGSLYLATIGKKARFVEDTYTPNSEEDASEIVIIVISISGETESIIKQVNLFKKVKASVISITHKENNALVELATLSISYAIPKNNFELSHVEKTPTQIPVIYFLEVMGKQLLRMNLKLESERNSSYSDQIG